MSTVPKFLAARHAGFACWDFVRDEHGSRVTGEALTAEEVFETGARVKNEFIALLKA